MAEAVAMLDETDLEVREGVDAETVATVQSMGAYKHGWETDIEMEFAPKGLNEDIVRLISERNGEPDWMTEWRLTALRRWQGMEEPRWALLDYVDVVVHVLHNDERHFYALERLWKDCPVLEIEGVRSEERTTYGTDEGHDEPNGSAPTA